MSCCVSSAVDWKTHDATCRYAPKLSGPTLYGPDYPVEYAAQQKLQPAYANTPTGDLEKRVNERFEALHTLLYQHSMRLDAHIELNRNFERNVIEKLEAVWSSLKRKGARLDELAERADALEMPPARLDAALRRIEQLERDIALDRGEAIKSEKLIAALLDRVNQLVEFHGIAPIGGARVAPMPEPCSVCGVDPTTREGFAAVAAKTRVIDGKRYCWACAPLPDEGT